ncbi:MAG: acyl carrier protein [Candidatus Rokubacteria bacterium]|nr:acyl carrier protein [Candidatus Rokubacteria bacterium]
MTDPTLARVLAILSGVARADRVPREPGADTLLGENGYWLDSVDMLEVILACEHEFDISLGDPDELTEEALASVGSLAALIARKLA